MIEIKLFDALQRKENEVGRPISWAEVGRAVNIPPKTLLGYRNGSSRRVDLDNLGRLAKWLGVEPGELLGWSDEQRG